MRDGDPRRNRQARSSHALERHEGEREGMPRVGRMHTAIGLAPLTGIERRKVRVAGGLGVYLGKVDAVGAREKLLEHPGAAEHDDLRRVSGERERVIDASELRIEPQRWGWVRLAFELLARRVKVIAVDVGVRENMDELEGLELHLTRHEMQEQGVLGHVERHAEHEIARALVHHERELSAGDEELEERVTGRKRCLIELARVPREDEHSAA